MQAFVNDAPSAARPLQNPQVPTQQSTHAPAYRCVLQVLLVLLSQLEQLAPVPLLLAAELLQLHGMAWVSGRNRKASHHAQEHDNGGQQNGG